MSGNIFHEIGAGLARRPLTGIAFCYIAGILAGARLKCTDFRATSFFLCILFLLVIFFGKRGKEAARVIPRRTAGFLFLVLVFLSGWLAMNWRVNNPRPDTLSALMDQPREGVEIIGTVVDDPVLLRSRHADSRYWAFAVKVTEINRLGYFQKARGEVAATMSALGVRPRYGEQWRFCGVLADKSRLYGTCQFSRRFTFQVADFDAPVLLKKTVRWNLVRRCFDLRETCAKVLTRGIEKHAGQIAVMQALVLGLQHELPPDLRAAFVATGTYHIFAISGQHIAIIAMFIIAVLQVYGVSRLHWFIYLAPALIVFTIMTGLSASAVRGCLMALACFLGPMLKRKPDIASAMALAALLILLVDPCQLFQAGFILSFGIVAGLIVLCPPLIELVKRKIAPDPWRLQPEDIFVRRLRQITVWFVFMITVSGAAWVVSTPLIAYWFNLVSPVALPANLAVIPLATAILLLGCLSIIFGWCPVIPMILNLINAFVVSVTLHLATALTHLPLGHFFVKSPPLWLIALWFAALLVWRFFYRKKRIWLTALLIFVVVAWTVRLAQKKEWEIHVVNVGGSAVCFVDSPEGSALVNAGPNYQARNVVNYLHRQGVNRLSSLILPVPDAEHCGGAADLIESIPVGQILLADADRKSKAAKELLLSAEKRKINVREQKPDEIFSFVSSNFFSVSFREETTDQSTVCLSFRQLHDDCFVICRQAAEARNWPPLHADDLSFGEKIVLGPGQGICFTPGRKRVEIEAVLLRQ